MTRLTSSTETLQKWLKMTDRQLSDLKDRSGPDVAAQRAHAEKTRGLMADELTKRGVAIEA